VLIVLDRSRGPQDALILDVEALGDAAALLVGHGNYRGLPEDWIIRHIKRTTQFRIVGTKHFPMALGEKYVKSQAKFAETEAKGISHAGLKRGILHLRSCAAAQRECSRISF
jgi:hypothetical protein